jgi:hypothetical protein
MSDPKESLRAESPSGVRQFSLDSVLESIYLDQYIFGLILFGLWWLGRFLRAELTPIELLMMFPVLPVIASVNAKASYARRVSCGLATLPVSLTLLAVSHGLNAPLVGIGVFVGAAVLLYILRRVRLRAQGADPTRSDSGRR